MLIWAISNESIGKTKENHKTNLQIASKCNASITDRTEQLGAWAVSALLGGLALGVFCILFGNSPLTTWGGIACIVIALANFLLALVKMLKK
jgi:lysozyme family protein